MKKSVGVMLSFDQIELPGWVNSSQWEEEKGWLDLASMATVDNEL